MAARKGLSEEATEALLRGQGSASPRAGVPHAGQASPRAGPPPRRARSQESRPEWGTLFGNDAQRDEVWKAGNAVERWAAKSPSFAKKVAEAPRKPRGMTKAETPFADVGISDFVQP